MEASQQEQEQEATAEGHRQRLVERFMANGIAALHAHEIVELILTFTIPRRDTKPIARELMRRHGSLSALLNANPDELVSTRGMGKRSWRSSGRSWPTA